MKVHYVDEFTCVVEPIWEMTNTYLYYFANISILTIEVCVNMDSH